MSVSVGNIASETDSISTNKLNSSVISIPKSDLKTSNNGYVKLNYTNGDYFEGFLIDSKRFKVGLQKWSDGDQYLGEYFNDKRHGWGRYSWFNDDIYEGSFYEDMRCGFGIYVSNNEDRFEGLFVNNKRDGFGVLKYSNGDQFYGLYKQNYRCGPGILYYKDGRRDIGLWYRNSILKLIVEAPNTFSIDQFNGLMKQYQFNQFEKSLKCLCLQSDMKSDEHELLEDEETKGALSVCHYRLIKPAEISIFEQGQEENQTEVKSIGEGEECQDSNRTISDKLQENDEELIKVKENFSPTNEEKENEPDDVSETNQNQQDDLLVDIPEQPITIEQIINQSANDIHATEERKVQIEFDNQIPDFLHQLSLPTNLTPTIQKIIRHIHKHQDVIPISFSDESDSSSNYSTINDTVKYILNCLFGTGTTEAMPKELTNNEPGENSRKSNNLLSLSQQGELGQLRQLFMQELPPNINVTDKNGAFSLLEATLTWDSSLINYLLDNGADINHVTDQGCSALGTCFLFYYPASNFISNIAEAIYNEDGPIELSQTPLNYNGVRREITAPPKLVHRITNLKEQPTNDELALLFEDIRAESEMKHEEEETWNSYQAFLIDEVLLKKASSLDIIDGKSQDFNSHENVIEYRPDASTKGQWIEKAASVLSHNSKLVRDQPRPHSCNQSISKDEGITRYLALKIARIKNMRSTIELLLNRGANPNISHVPFTALFFAVKSGDYEMAKLLISAGANVNCRLTEQNGSLTPLHIAVCLPGKTGVRIAELLLESGADPNAHACEDESFLDKTLMDEWSKDTYNEELSSLIGGKTPIHLVCARYDSCHTSHKICRILLDHGANQNLICNGHTALSLAIATGNDLIVNELLSHPMTVINQPLSHGNGNAFCVATSTAFEHTRTIDNRLVLLRKLIDAGANLLEPVLIGSKRMQGTAIDYSYHIFNLDQRISRLPYHALTGVERDLFNNRRKILSYMGMYTREAAVEKEKQRLESFKLEGIESRGPSPDFVYTGAGADTNAASESRSGSGRVGSCSLGKKEISSVEAVIKGSELMARITLGKSNWSNKMVTLHIPVSLTRDLRKRDVVDNVVIRKPLLKYCYDCGRSVNVKLTACTRCREVFFCSKLCKTKAWNTRHKFECLRVGGRASTAGQKSTVNQNKGADSPTPATIGDDRKRDGDKAGNEADEGKDGVRLNKAELVDKIKSSSTNQAKFNLIKLSAKSTKNKFGPGALPRQLPPLDPSITHPSYSYMFVQDQYIKIDAKGNIIALSDKPFVDNYSFV